MAEPGTAYDDPAIGKDPQVATMEEYVETDEDNGGVHLNSGIPNKAFHLAATGLGGNAWDGAGKIWYAALTSGIGADTDFAGFAAATVAAAEKVSDSAAEVVRGAWAQVGVTALPGSGGSGSGSAGSAVGGSGSARVVAVTRTGGFGGIRRTGEVQLGDDPRTPEVESLIGRIDFRGLSATRPQPDRFVYTFDVDEEHVVVAEQDLTPELHQLSRLLLDG
jgi:hypothetical protein